MSFLWCVMILGVLCLNESPSEKEGKLGLLNRRAPSPLGLNESPSEKEGK